MGGGVGGCAGGIERDLQEAVSSIVEWREQGHLRPRGGGDHRAAVAYIHVVAGLAVQEPPGLGEVDRCRRLFPALDRVDHHVGQVLG